MSKFRVWEVTIPRWRYDVIVWAYPNAWLLCAYAFLAYHLHAIWHQPSKDAGAYLLGALIWCLIVALHRHLLYKPIMELLKEGGAPDERANSNQEDQHDGRDGR